ncbi:MAG: LCP family protein [Syntrophomonadaceae bacterium]|nr:LCP family protein [Syntrophomonadaceae bacterium]
MKKFRDPRIILFLIVSLTLISAQLDKAFPQSIRQQVKNGKLVNILLLGIDARPGETNTRSDTIILASIDHNLKEAVLLWIPRDTRIYTSNKSKKINMVNQLQGPAASCKTVEKLLETNVDYYVLTNFSGFERIIDLLGGVYMDVDINLYSPSSGVRLSKGYKCLTGKEALKYARYRDVKDGDIGRTGRQQKLIRALIKQTLKKENISKIPDLFAELQQNVDTNLSSSDLLYLSSIIYGLNEDNIVTQTLPGYSYNDPYSGASYWEVDRKVSRQIIENLFNRSVSQ